MKTTKWNERPRMVNVIPEGERPTAKINHLTLTDEDIFLDNLRYLRHGNHFMMCTPGKYVRLVTDRGLQMSDTDMEWRTNRELLHRANGKVLIAGLGIGFVLGPLCLKPEVESVTVVELNADVIALVEPHVRHPKLTVIWSDIYDYRKKVKRGQFDTIYFDIWGDLSTDNLKEMGALQRKFAVCLNRQNPQAWINCWSRSELKVLKRRGY